MKVLLLSAYDAMSHRYWRTGLVNHFPDIQWTVLSLPPRYFSWRVRGNSLSWGFGERTLLAQHYDALIVTSMVDLSALRGFVPELARIPTAVYFHENQFVYPQSNEQLENQGNLLEAQVLSLYSALCADMLVFNSHYNKNTFIAGAKALLKKLPDAVPGGLLEQISQNSCVIPVPLRDLSSSPKNKTPERLQLVWNHRWEYDKNPLGLFEFLLSLPANLSITCHIVGQQFRNSPEIFNKIKALLKERGWEGCWGFIENEAQYLDLLTRSDMVLSTAHHDFQGIAVLEAVAAGCVPLVPNRLAYPELFPEEFCYDDASLTERFLAFYEALLDGKCKIPSVENLAWRELKEDYRRLLNTLNQQNDAD